MSEKQTGSAGSGVDPTGPGIEPTQVGRSPVDALYSAVTESLPDTSVTVFDGALRFRMAYGEALSFNGWTNEDLDGKTAGEVLPATQLALLEPLFRGALAGRRASVEVPSLDGTRTLWTRIAPLEEGGVVIGGVAISVDITDRKRAEEAHSRLAAIVEQSPDAIVGITPDDTIFAWNAGAERLLYYRAREAVGAPLAMLVPAHNLQAELGVWERIHAGETVERQTQRLRQDGTLVDVSVIGSPIRGSGGAVIGASEIARDISEQRRVEAKLAYLANHDPLTGLLNRRAFEQELSAAVAFANRYAMPTSLLMLDLDHFKYINDSYGHSVGDAILRRVGNLLGGRLRETDVIARLGGDEFAVILPGLSAAEGRRVTEDLLGMLRADATTRVQGQVVSVTASVGLVEIQSDSEMSPDELLAHADIALYTAKESSRGTISVNEFTHEGGSAFQARLNWAERIRKALEDDSFVLFEQPILSLATGQVDRRELLLRMRTEHDELVEASSFLPIAERFNLMPDIDLWVIRHALDRLEAQNGNGDAARVHINLSGASMSDPRILSALPESIAASEVDAKRLVFEITETAAIQSIEHAQHLCGQLCGLGCEIALDDFGSGFAAFAYLKQLPFECLKIDGGFIRQLTRSHIDRIAVRAIVDMAQGLQKSTIAESVEDEQTLELVRELGIDHAQGLHTGGPRLSRNS
jgi:diguanylate cyclase (GGDEF)-like protein/PAS domain S-box-containing protein